MLASDTERGPAARDADGPRVRALLRDSASWWASKARLETCPDDRIWMCLRCPACEAIFDRVFRVPNGRWTSGDTAPLYRSATDVELLLDSARRARPAMIDPGDWAGGTMCSCGESDREIHVVATALLHAVVGTGASVVALRLAEEGPGTPATWLRLADGAGSLEPIEASAFQAQFGQPLMLFEAWATLSESLPVSAETVTGVAAEPGVWLFAAASDVALRAGVLAKLGETRRVLVHVDPTTIRGPWWPSSLCGLADQIEHGSVAALVVEVDALLAQARALARSRHAADVVDTGEPHWSLVTARGEWHIAPIQIVLSMVRRGATLGRACAHALADAAREVEDRVATLQALTALVPGASFVVEGTKALAHTADGRPTRAIDLTAIPSGAGSLPADVLAREAAFVFDVAPRWADRSRVCSCGAACSVERRLVAWPTEAAGHAQPWLLNLWGNAESQRVAEVVALCCDRHVRIPSEAELREMGIDETRLAMLLDMAGTFSTPPVHAWVWDGSEGERVVLVRGPMISGVVLYDQRLRALHDALGAPLGEDREHGVGWALGGNALALGAAGTADPTVERAIAECGISIEDPFWIRREVDLSSSPAGAFDVVIRRNGRT